MGNEAVGVEVRPGEGTEAGVDGGEGQGVVGGEILRAVSGEGYVVFREHEGEDLEEELVREGEEHGRREGVGEVRCGWGRSRFLWIAC